MCLLQATAMPCRIGQQGIMVSGSASATKLAISLECWLYRISFFRSNFEQNNLSITELFRSGLFVLNNVGNWRDGKKIPDLRNWLQKQELIQATSLVRQVHPLANLKC
jgi:hypothetical protein